MEIKHLSPSSLSTFRKCPEQWRRRYVNGEKIAPGIAMHRGKGTHGAAEVNHLQKRDSWVDLPLDVLQDAAADAYDASIEKYGVILGADQSPADVGAGKDAAVALTKVYLEKIAPTIQPVLVEEPITIDMGLDLPLLMYLDVYTIDNRIPDLKTASKKKSQLEVDVSSQLTAYAKGIHVKTGEWPKEVSLEVMVTTKTPGHQHLASTRNEADWQRMVACLDLMLKQIKAGLYPPCDPASWACSPRWCGYYKTCRYARR